MTGGPTLQLEADIRFTDPSIYNQAAVYPLDDAKIDALENSGASESIDGGILKDVPRGSR